MGIRRPTGPKRPRRRQQGDTGTPPPLYGAGTGDWGALSGAATSSDDALYFGADTYFGPGTYFGGPPLGASFLSDTLSPYARLAVEIAFGADPTGDPTDWFWTDVTADVRQSSDIDIKVGKADEASKPQPATLRLTLDNTTGAYSRGPHGLNHPYVRRGVPVRVSVNLGENLDGAALPGRPPGLSPGRALVPPQRTFRTRFLGYADGFTPQWDMSGNDATSVLEASGVLRRLGQGSSPLPSPARRAITRLPGLLAYWPLEDDKFATTVSSAVEGVAAMGVVGGPPQFAVTKTTEFSDPVMQVHDAVLVGAVPAYVDTGQLQVRFMVSMTDEGVYDSDFADLVTFYTTGTVNKWTISLGQGILPGTFVLIGRSAGVAPNVVTIPDNVDSGVGYVVDRPTIISVNLIQVGADFTVELAYYYPGDAFYTFYTKTVTSSTFGQIAKVVVHGNPLTSGVLDHAFLGHLYARSIATAGSFLTAFGIATGETAAARMVRLCAANNIPLTVHGTTTAQMGPQDSRKLLDLLQDTEAVEQGVIVDGVSQGLDFYTHASRENLTATLTLDAQRGKLSKEFAPVDDDQATRNKWEVKRSGGPLVTVADTDGPLGTATIGVYDSSTTINTNSDARLGDYAGWLVHLGTHDGFRFPQVSIDLAKNPELATDWIATRPTHRVDVTNVRHKRTQLPEDDVALQLVGYRETLNRYRWNATLNCTPYDSWRVARYATSHGDTSELVLRAQTDGSTLPAGADQGDTTLSVVTASGPLWTVAAQDFPMTLDVGGFPVVCSAIVDVDTTTQTFTVAALAQTIPAGAVVDLWRPPVPGL